MSDLIPQVPGEIPGADLDALAPALRAPIGEIIASLDGYTDAQLEGLALLETHGENREGLLLAIVGEIESRADPVPTVAVHDEASPAPIGDDHSYVHKHWRDVDASKLARPVLTKDGWLHPTPKASPEN